MKQKYKYVLNLLFLLWSGNAISQDSFRIHGELKGDTEGQSVYLYDFDQVLIDSTVIRNGNFVFLGTVQVPDLYRIVIDNKKHKNPRFFPTIPLFLANREMNVRAHVDSLSSVVQEQGGQYDFSKVEVIGGQLHQDYLQYALGYTEFVDKRKKKFRAYLDFLNYEDPYGDVHKGIRLVEEVDQAAEERNGFVEKYIKENPTSYVSLYALRNNLKVLEQASIERSIERIDSVLLTSNEGQKMLSEFEALKASAVGALYQDMVLQDTASRPVHLSDLLGKGKYVLLEFWASWCVPCRADIPHLKRSFELYNNAGFELVSVSMDTKREDWLRAVKEEKMPWLQLSELKGFKGDLAGFYQLTGVPTCILFDPEGRIVTRNMRGSWMDKMLIALYGDKFGTSLK